MFLLDDILLAPIKGMKWIGEKLRDFADKELYDPDKIREELMTLQARLDMEEISPEDYAVWEKELLQRLTEIQEREKGGGNE